MVAALSKQGIMGMTASHVTGHGVQGGGSILPSRLEMK